MIGAGEGVLRHYAHAPAWVPQSGEVWFIGLAVWLKSAEPKSKSLYLVLGSLTLSLLLGVSSLARYLPGLLDAAFALADAGLAIASIFIFRDEMEKHFNEVDPIGLRLSGIMTFFFSVLYFQYWFHEMYEAQNAVDTRLTPGPA